MKLSDIDKLEKGAEFQCCICQGKLIYGQEEIHFMSKPVFFDGSNRCDAEGENLFPVCECCYNKMFGKDHEHFSD